MVFRRNPPTRRIRGSSLRVRYPVPIRGLALSMVANLMSPNFFPPLPTRSWR